MTASTAQITLPGRHRTDAPTWRPHVTFAWITFLAALAVYAARTFDATFGRRETVAVVAVVAFVLATIAAVLVLR